MNLAESFNEIQTQFDAHAEWLLTESSGAGFALRRDEIEIACEREKMLLSFLDSKGFQTWRVAAYKIEDEKIHFNLTRSFNRENIKIRFAPRVLSAELAQSVELARLDKANKIAALVVADKARTKLVSVRLNRETGRFAQIIYEKFPGVQIAALAGVSGDTAPERILSFAVLWSEKLSSRRKNPVGAIEILAEKKTARNLTRLRALLTESWQAKIKVIEILNAEDESKITDLELRFAVLWGEKPKKFQSGKEAALSATARQITALAPSEIDVIFSRHGETLRFRGLPFARVRKIFGEERAWFGIEAKRRILNEKTYEEFSALLEDLKTHRRFDAGNKRHEFYRRAPEAWLESVLRKNVKQLDANLILSPVYNQFRVSGDRIDLLALRRDGRLVIIELKTQPDREIIFQAADYWRQIELHRRAGNINKAKIFGDAQISDQPALVYLVAPMLSFHPDFKFLAATVSPEIEIARFDLNENWRENLKVMARDVIGSR